VARDRKRAKQRQQRRPQRTPASTGPEIHRADVPGALGHASGDVDEFDAALIRGAHGTPVAPEEQLDALPDPAPDDGDPTNGALAESDLPAAGNGGGGGGGGANADAAQAFGGDDADAAPASPPRQRRQPLPLRAVGFLRASWAELQRVQWPDRPQVSQATAVVLGFVAIAGAYLGAADWVATKIVNFIL
jgi:preprotein translocase subunit SecE